MVVPALAPGIVHETLYERMSRTTGLELRDETDVAFIVQAGVPAAAYERSAAELRLPLGYLLSAAQMKLELALHRCLPPEAGDRLMRAVERADPDMDDARRLRRAVVTRRLHRRRERRFSRQPHSLYAALARL